MDNTMIAFATLLLETAKELISRGGTIEEVIRFATKAVSIFDKATDPVGEEQISRVVQYAVRLQSFGNKKIDCIKIVRQFNPGMGLKEAKELVETAPCTVLKTDDEEEARSMWRAFQELNTLGDLSNLCNEHRGFIICL